MAKDKSKGYGDIAETLAPKMSSAISKYLATLFDLKWLEKNMDVLDAVLMPISLVISWILPNSGPIKIISVIKSMITANKTNNFLFIKSSF